MSRTLEYLRVSEAELNRARGDPWWARDLFHADFRAGPLPAGAPRDPRLFDAYKYWYELGFLLERCYGGPVEVAWNEQFLAAPEDELTYLTAEQVHKAADWLVGASFDLLLGSVRPEERTWVYRLNLGCRDDVEVLRETYEGLVLFFVEAAVDNEAVLMKCV